MPRALRTFNKKHLTINVFVSLLVFLVILLTVNLQPSTVFAQAPYDKAKEDYSIQLKKYNQAKISFVTAKSSYTAFQTATAKKEAFEKTKSYLTETNFLITNYLFIVKEYGNQIDWQNSTIDRTNLFKTIDEEIDFLQNQWHEIQNAATLEELPPFAVQLSGRLNDSTEPKIGKVTATFEIAKIEIALKKFNSLSQKLIDFVTPRINTQNRAIVANWQSEISSIDSSTKALLENSKNTLAKTKADKNNTFRIKQIIEDTSKAKSELKRSKNLFEEILKVT